MFRLRRFALASTHGENVHHPAERRDRGDRGARDVWRRDQARDRFIGDEHREHEQHGAVGLPAEHLGAAPAVGQRLAAGTLHEADHDQRERQRTGVGEHVRGVGEQGQRPGDDAGDDLDGHEPGNQREGNRQVASIRVGADLVRVASVVAAVVMIVHDVPSR